MSPRGTKKAQDAFGDVGTGIRHRLERLDLLDLVEPICKRHMVTVEDVGGRRRFRAVSQCRHEIWAALVATGHWTTTRIADLFGVDHGSVWHGVRKAAERQKQEVAA